MPVNGEYMDCKLITPKFPVCNFISQKASIPTVKRIGQIDPLRIVNKSGIARKKAILLCQKRLTGEDFLMFIVLEVLCVALSHQHKASNSLHSCDYPRIAIQLTVGELHFDSCKSLLDELEQAKQAQALKVQEVSVSFRKSDYAADL